MSPYAFRRTGGVIVPLLLAMCAVTGCMRVARTLQVNTDGSGMYTLTVGFREPTPGNPTSVSEQISEPMAAFAAHVQQTGGASRTYSDQTYAYWSFDRPFASLSQADTLLQDDPQRFDSRQTPLLFHDALRITRNSGPVSSVIHVTGTISLIDRFQNAQAWQDATETVTISMAGGISVAHGGIREGNSVTYHIGYNQSATIDVIGDTESTLSPFSVWAVVLGIVALILAVMGILLVSRAARARR